MQKFCKLSPYISDIYKLSGVDHSGLFIYYVRSAKVLSTNREQKAAFCYFWGRFFSDWALATSFRQQVLIF